MKIYLASSWRNTYHPLILQVLLDAGHEVYNFREPIEGDTGFHWSDVDPDWKKWRTKQFVEGIQHPIAQKGFGLDMKALNWAEAVVILFPCGLSSHLEAGHGAGAGKFVYALILDDSDLDVPELMYNMFTRICTTPGELVEMIAADA